MRRSLSRINARKAPGPDKIPGCKLRDCAVEVTDVFTDIFNISLSQAVVPTCFKATTIIPVSKNSSPSCFNDYHPVALTPILMKCFERLVMHHIKSAPPPGPLPVCISVQPLDQWRHRHCPPPSPHTSRQKRLICQNAVHRLQFSIQHYPPSTAHLQTGPACCWTSWLGDLRYYGSAVTHQVHLTEHRGSQECVLSPLLFTLLTHD